MTYPIKLVLGITLSLALFVLARPGAGQPLVCQPSPGDGVDTVTDLGLVTGFQDTFFGHLKRGRATVAADFNLDGDVDFYLGNPGDESMILKNNFPAPFTAFDLMLFDEQEPTERDLAWGAAAADYDNDGDYDLYISNGGNECFAFDKLLENTVDVNGNRVFVDVTAAAGIKGPVPPGGGDPVAMASGNGVWGDYNNDGDIDLFVNGNSNVACPPDPPGNPPAGAGFNTLWENNGDGTFTDVTVASGLRGNINMPHQAPSRHSTFIDFDNDDDLDLYEQNDKADNVLWRNKGDGTFEDVTQLFSVVADLRDSSGSFSSCAGDFNNDGWEDIMVFTRTLEAGDVGHNIFLNETNVTGGFRDVGMASGINDLFVGADGVMGSQIGDLNGDGVLDVFMGNGGPMTGRVNRLFLSNSQPNADPTYRGSQNLINCPAPEDGVTNYPVYPYRTHGTTMTDVDNDGTLELMINNGGPGVAPEFPEPNRLFKFEWIEPFNWFKVRPVGDGTLVSRDGIGTRLALTVKNGPFGEPYTLYRTLYGGSCFSAQNGFDVFFGLGDADIIESLVVTWADGFEEDKGSFAINDGIVVERQ